MLRTLSILAALTAAGAAHAQSTAVATPSPAGATSQQVFQLAPQLVQFTGSQANFDSIVSGLTQGVPVTITTTDAAGTVQIVTFTPPATLSAADAARVVESARNALITRGVATPTAQQIAVALVGGPLVTPNGTTTIPAAIPGTTSTTLVQVRNEVGTVPLTTATGANVVSGNNLQALRASLAQTGLSPFEVNQSLQLAANLLAQNGIVSPTAQQLQIALNGGSLVLADGQTVVLAGVLPGRLSASTGATAPLGATTTTGTTSATANAAGVGLAAGATGLTAPPVAGPTPGTGPATGAARAGPGLRR